MTILGVETSCDETALSIVEAHGGMGNPSFKLVGSTLFSQVELHKKYGGVFPQLAKREHAKNLIPLLRRLLEETGFDGTSPRSPVSRVARPHPTPRSIHPTAPPSKQEQVLQDVSKLLEREYGLLKEFLEYVQTIEKPAIDAIAVTYGPGLEPALWVGVNFAKALGLVWNIPVIPTNHMEGHILSPLLDEHPKPISFPALALLISGGHTELVLIEKWGQYQAIGATRDDAVGEAFDKVARLLSLPYPGGPEISKLAHEARINKYLKIYELPRPMIHTDNYEFSFSGLKTAVLYGLKDNPANTKEMQCDMARAFEDAITDVLITKTRKALDVYDIRSLIIGGGVIANGHLRSAFVALCKEYPDLSLYVPSQALSTDNATMIAMAGYIASHKGPHTADFRAKGNLSL